MPPSRPGQRCTPSTVGRASTFARGDRHLVELVMAVAIEQAKQTVLAADADHLVLLAVDVVANSGLTWLKSASCTSWGMNWRYQRSLPVLASSATSESV